MTEAHTAEKYYAIYTYLDRNIYKYTEYYLLMIIHTTTHSTLETCSKQVTQYTIVKTVHHEWNRKVAPIPHNVPYSYTD